MLMARACPTNRNFYDLVDSIHDWAESDVNKNFFNDAYEAAFKMIETEFHGMSIKTLEHNPELSAGQVGSFKARLRELTQNIRNGSLETKWAETWWRPATGFAAKDPVVGKLLKDMQRSGFHFRANEMRDTTLFHSILEELKTEAGRRSGKYFKGRSWKQAQDKLDALDVEYRQSITDFQNRVPGADDELIRIKNDMDELVQNSELKVFDDLLYLVEGKKTKDGDKVIYDAGIPKLLQDKFLEIKKSDPSRAQRIEEGKAKLEIKPNDLLKLTLENGDSITEHPALKKSLQSYITMMDGLYDTLRGGVRKILKSRQLKMEHAGHDTKKIKATLESLESKLMPKYEQGYFPHYTRDLNASFMDGLMSKVEELQASTTYDESIKTRSVDDILDDMKNYADGHVTGRAEDYDYSKNFVNSVGNYISDVNRFNFAAFMDAHIVDSLTKVEKIYKAKGDAGEYARSITSYIEEMHRAVNGDNDISRNTRAMMKSLLGFEFISKLGFNPRGAARNFTQRLLDYVHWGPVQVGKAKKYLEAMTFETGDHESYIEKALRESGLLFQSTSPEFTQSGLDAPANIFKTRVWNDADGKWEMVKETTMEKVAKGVQAVAGTQIITGLHRGAENLNRAHTFKIAFAQMHKWLSNGAVQKQMLDDRSKTDYGKKLLAEGKGDSILTTAQYEAEIRRQSKNYAINMVIMNHFDYGDYAKNKASRTKMGRFMLQFQHYSFEFFEKNLKILREAKHDVATGNLLNSLNFFVGKDSNAHGLEKAYRMSLLYFMVPAVVSQIFGVNANNLVEHDTIERMKQWFTYFTSEDDDEVDAAFFGKGPILGTVGGPLLSDIIDIGVMTDLVSLDEDSILTLISGLEANDPSTSTEVGRKIKILNTFLGRAYERHYPSIRGGQIGFALQQEFGFYPTAKARKAKREERQASKRTGLHGGGALPTAVEMALSRMEQEGQKV